MCRVHGPLARCECGYACFFVSLAALGLALTACGLLPPKTPEVDPCAVEITRLESLRSAEVYGACAGQTFDDCAPTIDRIDTKYAPLILEQIRCDR